MTTLYIERSAAGGRNGNWIAELALEPAPERIVVGTGPGSFAGIRAALAFAQGYALGRACEGLGLPSPCAIVGELLHSAPQLPPASALAVVGDARRGMAWIALFDGFKLATKIFQVEVFQVPQAELKAVVPADHGVVTPDAARIGTLLEETFGDRYLGGRTPTAEGLRAFAEANPSVLRSEPLPIYLNPAVRMV